MKFCAQCGQGNSDDATFCVQCGKEFSAGAEESTLEDSGKTAPEEGAVASPAPSAAAITPGQPGVSVPSPVIPPPPGVQAPPPGMTAGPPVIPPPGYIPLQRKVTEGFAIAALILGCVGFLFYCVMPVTGILAVIFGYTGRRKIQESNGALEGDGMCIAGIVLGFIQIGLSIIGIIFLIILAVVAENTEASAIAPVLISVGMLSLF